MFTGIVEAIGEVTEVRRHGSNLDLVVRSPFSADLRIDQSVSHDGVCLTVAELMGDRHRVTAVEETLRRSTLGDLEPGDKVNLERGLKVGDRLDGHMVQGHVDMTTKCLSVQEHDGSWWFTFALAGREQLIVAKGSICLNGVSLTVADLGEDRFSVAVIPYTHEHTTFQGLRAGDRVNVEFDVLGKYVQRMMTARG